MQESPHWTSTVSIDVVMLCDEAGWRDGPWPCTYASRVAIVPRYANRVSRVTSCHKLLPFHGMVGSFNRGGILPPVSDQPGTSKIETRSTSSQEGTKRTSTQRPEFDDETNVYA